MLRSFGCSPEREPDDFEQKEQSLAGNTKHRQDQNCSSEAASWPLWSSPGASVSLSLSLHASVVSVVPWTFLATTTLRVRERGSGDAAGVFSRECGSLRRKVSHNGFTGVMPSEVKGRLVKAWKLFGLVLIVSLQKPKHGGVVGPVSR